MIQSMTGYAAQSGTQGASSWLWEIRSVNSRGLDMRWRLPDLIANQEADLRAKVQKVLARGGVQISLKIEGDTSSGQTAIDPERLDRVLADLETVQSRAAELGVTLVAASAADVVSMRGVIAGVAPVTSDSLEAILADFDKVLSQFVAARAQEGEALQTVIRQRIDDIEGLLSAAKDQLGPRKEAQAEGLSAALERLRDGSMPVEPGRVEQELALIAIKSDVTEEIDRLYAHVAAARDLLTANSPIGRKFDFLAQEFNREANTLCSKSGHAGLTAIGLDLKLVIDQMREQIQNLE